MEFDVNILSAKPRRLIKNKKVIIVTDDIKGFTSEIKRVVNDSFICGTIRLNDYMGKEDLETSQIYFVTKNKSNINWFINKKVLENIVKENIGDVE